MITRHSILFLMRWFERKKGSIDSFFDRLVPYAWAVVITCALFFAAFMLTLWLHPAV